MRGGVKGKRGGCRVGFLVNGVFLWDLFEFTFVLLTLFEEKSLCSRSRSFRWVKSKGWRKANNPVKVCGGRLVVFDFGHTHDRGSTIYVQTLFNAKKSYA